MKNIIFKHVDQKIKRLFQLYCGVRSKDEDDRMYDKIMGLVFEEIIEFITQNLFEDEVENLLEDSPDGENSEAEEKLLLLGRYMKKIPDCEFRIKARLDHFINRLHYLSAKGNFAKE
ncbi:hypothetical protein JXA63_05040 [Candidatus Woesebacteria bacterium]|nr:hypothetical protein [Candidatus Woesebacteria bacterium]